MRGAPKPQATHLSTVLWLVHNQTSHLIHLTQILLVHLQGQRRKRLTGALLLAGGGVPITVAVVKTCPWLVRPQPGTAENYTESSPLNSLESPVRWVLWFNSIPQMGRLRKRVRQVTQVRGNDEASSPSNPALTVKFFRIPLTPQCCR